MPEIGAGDEIVVTKWIALKKSGELAEMQREKLLERFPESLVDRAADFKTLFSTDAEKRIMEALGVKIYLEPGEGGIFKALWDMGSAYDLGLRADLKLIPIKQETVEICNYFDLNPYEADSKGSLVIAAPNGGRLCRALMDEGINAAVIGEFTKGNDRVVVNGERVRFLTP